MPAPTIISSLIERFERNISSYKTGIYNEAQVRQEFINPFFEALGWDIYNKNGYAEAYKDVIHEYSQKTFTGINAPDYGFRIGGQLKFFVEAKKPGINIKEDIHPAYQLRRYAWSSKLPLSILTDFEEFAVYDCRIPPKANDQASAGRILFFTYKDYSEKWNEIVEIFSPEEIKKGSFDRYAASGKNKKGTAEVDEKFLDVLKEWREVLAKNIALRNTGITTRELNFAVQKTIDRIIFLRICEDRGVEEYGQLLALQNGVNVYKRLLQVFTRADEKYNSGLFHFEKEKERSEEPDYITPNIEIDDKLLKEIFKNLYYPNSPFEFSVLPADILGQVYEQFLGKVIRLTEGHQAKVEDKPEVKKAGGVYYTPTYIVNYIVENTLGKLLSPSNEAARIEQSENLRKSPVSKGSKSAADAGDSARQITPKDVSKLKIVDPACGSGSFLIVAYQYMLDWHLKYYTDENNKVNSLKKNFIFETQTGDYRLTTNKRKRILLNNIYGVDIDSSAVEVTKLSLLLRVLEGETEQTLANQMSLFKQRALPDLGSNIKCGNSLIGPDFYDQMEMNFLDDEEKLRINVFDWKTEFKEIMSNGGFDVVIGNPPYGALIGTNEKKYFYDKYLINYQQDSYILFLEEAIQIVKTNGLVGFIIPNTWLFNLTYSKIRKHLFINTEIKIIRAFQKAVFKNATVDTEVIILSNSAHQYNQIQISIVDKNEQINNHLINQKEWIDKDGDPINIFSNNNYKNIISTLSNNSLLGNISKITQGTKPFQVGKGKPPQTRKVLDEKPFVGEIKIDQTFKPLLRGSLINRYQILWNNNYYISFGDWLAEPRYSANFDAKIKIIIRQTGDSLIATIDERQFIVRDNLYTIIIGNEDDNYFILGVLNSKLLTWFYQNVINYEKGEALAQVKRGHLILLPIKDINNQNEAILKEKVINTVKNIINLSLLTEKNKNKGAARNSPQDRKFGLTTIQRIRYG